MMQTVISEEEKKFIDDLVERLKNHDISAYLALYFMSPRQKTYFRVKSLIEKSKETHPCKQESASTQADSVAPDNCDARKRKSHDGLSSPGSESTLGGA